jgi:putative Holliday junction resolvase
MRIIGLDHGEKRIGVAVSDPLGLTAQPIAVIEPDQIIEELKMIIQEYGDVEEIVVGLPKKLSGELGPQAEKVLKFIEDLKDNLQVKVTAWDERLTTAAAERSMIDAGLSRSKRKKIIDKSAAALILQSYLDNKDKK